MIKFGTDGWRAVIADEFTFENVQIITQAVADFVKSEAENNQELVIGYDNRFLSEKFARTTAEVLASNDIKVYLCSQSVPTPVVSYTIVEKKCFGGVMITASHNPCEYNGYKLKMSCGSSATKEITRKVEKNLRKNTPQVNPDKFNNIEVINPKQTYIDYIKSTMEIEKIQNADFEIIVDNLYGSGAGYLSDILKDTNIKVTEIHDYRDPLFGGINPEPLDYNTRELTGKIKKEQKWRLGVVLDGDADRIGLVASDGRFMTAQEVCILILLFLLKYKKKKGAVAKAYNMTRMLNKFADKYNFDLIETKIGFKHLAPYLINKEVVLAAEESGGYGTALHIPERDGVFNAMLIIELLAITNKTPEDLMAEIMNETGYYFYGRVDLPIKDAQTKDRIIASLENGGPESFGEVRVKDKKVFDGIKFFLENDGWILFRKSGTENLLRVYAEGRSKANLQSILADGENFINKFYKK